VDYLLELEVAVKGDRKSHGKRPLKCLPQNWSHLMRRYLDADKCFLHHEKWTPNIGQCDKCISKSSRQSGSGFIVNAVRRLPVAHSTEMTADSRDRDRYTH